ncbi:MAG: hypothetical protein QNJ53_24200 [Pleurocapsa sp. MO_192.B19]|nr:hypothetical protein [Pleurocapsa sp. MO_192.B19]
MTNDLLLIFTSIGTPDNNITLGVLSENAITTFADILYIFRTTKRKLLINK